MLKNLLQSPDEAVLPAEEKGQTASLWRERTKVRTDNNVVFSDKYDN